MKNWKLSIDLLPQGAWGNDLSKALPKKDWDTLRSFCYEKYKHKCGICGIENVKLYAHEVWIFNEEKKTQTLVNIIALCSKCHGVKHMRNSERLGYGDVARKHFMKTNKCDSLIFAKHYVEQKARFEDLGKIYRWKMIADLDNFGGKGIKIKNKYIPFINSDYNYIDWSNVKFERTNLTKKIKLDSNLVLECEPISCQTLADDLYEARYFAVRLHDNFPPKINCIYVDNYSGTITIDSERVNRIEWYAECKNIKTQYNVSGRFIVDFSVKDLKCNNIYFKLIGSGGDVYSQKFTLSEM